MSMMRSAALAATLSLALAGTALAGGRGGGNNDSGSGLNPNTQLTGNDRTGGVNSGGYDPYLRQRLDHQGWNGYGRNGYWERPVRLDAPPRMVPPFGGYPY